MRMIETTTKPETAETSVAGSLRRDALHNRVRILEAAADLFGRYGVDEVSMHQIAVAAGIGQGTLYRNFEHKGDLCGAMASEAVAALKRKIDGELRREVPAVVQLERVIERFVDFSEKFAPVICGMSDAACGSRRTELYRSPLYGWMYGTVVGLLERAMAQGDIRPLDPAYTADALLALFDINLRLYQRRERGFSRDRILQGMRSFISRGLGVAPPQGELGGTGR